MYKLTIHFKVYSNLAICFTVLNDVARLQQIIAGYFFPHSENSQEFTNYRESLLEVIDSNYN